MFGAVVALAHGICVAPGAITTAHLVLAKEYSPAEPSNLFFRAGTFGCSSALTNNATHTIGRQPKSLARMRAVVA